MKTKTYEIKNIDTGECFSYSFTDETSRREVLEHVLAVLGYVVNMTNDENLIEKAIFVY